MSTNCRGLWNAEAFWRIQEPRLSVPGGPDSSGLPCPAIAGDKDPSPIVIGGPAPGISRHPSKPKARRERPRAIHKRVPTRSGEVRLPHHSIARRVEEIAVVSEILRAVCVRRITVVRIAGVADTILVLLFVPRIERLLFNILGQGVTIVVREIEIGGLV